MPRIASPPLEPIAFTTPRAEIEPRSRTKAYRKHKSGAKHGDTPGIHLHTPHLVVEPFTAWVSFAAVVLAFRFQTLRNYVLVGTQIFCAVWTAGGG